MIQETEIYRGRLRMNRCLCFFFALLLCSCPYATTRARQSVSQNEGDALQDVASGSTRRSGTDAHALGYGETVEQEIDKGGAHDYRLTLTANQFLRVVVEQRGIDVVLTLFAPDGSKLAAVDSPYGGAGLEVLMYVTGTSGKYRLEVRAQEFNPSAPRRYRMKLEELRAAAPTDKTRIAAQTSFSEAEHLRYDKAAGAQRRAKSLYQEALSLFASLGDRANEALALRGIGELQQNVGKKAAALGYYNQALQIQKLEGDAFAEAQTLHSAARVYFSMERYEDALESYENARNLYDTSGHVERVPTVMIEMSMTYARLGDRDKASYYLDESKRIRTARDGPAGEVELPALTREVREDNQKLLDYDEQVLRIRQAAGDSLGQAKTLSSLGATCMGIGDNQKSLIYFGRALQIYRTLNSSPEQQSSPRFFEEVELLRMMGEASFASGDYRRALDYLNQALGVQRAHPEFVSRPTENFLLYDIGKVYNYLGEKRGASEFYEQALSLRPEAVSVDDRMTLLHLMGGDSAALGEEERALDYFNAALALARSVADGGAEAGSLYRLARVEHDRGNLATARVHIEAALGVVESLRARIGSQQLRTAYFASVHEYYEFYIALLMQLRNEQPAGDLDAAALQASEHARARGLLELLSGRVEIQQEIDPLLLAREKALRQKLSADSEREARLRGSAMTREQSEAAEKELAEVESEIESLLSEYARVEAKIRAKSSRYAALTQPQPLKLKEIQQMLDPETLLLEYALGEEHSYLWAVTPDTISSFELPKRAEIEAITRRVYESLTERNRGVRGETPGARRERIRKADTQYTTSAAALSEMILRPLGTRLGRKRLVVVSDGALQFIPFTALPSPSDAVGANAEAARPPLVVEHEIVSLPSAAVLAVLRRELRGRKPAAKAVAVLADPVFDTDDERVRARDVGGSSVNVVKSVPGAHVIRDVESALEDVGEASLGRPLSRLLSTRREARQILSNVPAAEGFQALDFDAGRRTVIGGQLEQFRVLHFATHALINPVHPELSGIVLSLVDEGGRPQDGFLRVQDIFNLNLPAELVVLSACRTGLGRRVKGEGLIGFTRAFMYAGTPRVVGSLWSIDDRTTADLMSRFYDKMFGAARLAPAAALRAAQIEMWQAGDRPSPYYWAAFTLQGEWK